MTTDHSMAATLNHILPLNRLTTLVLEYDDISFLKVIELLQFTSSLHTLTFGSMLLKNIDYMAVQQTESFQFVSTKNNIKHLIVENNYCTLEKVRFLVALCPRVQHLTIHTTLTDFQSTIRFLLDTSNPNTRDLSSLCFSRASHIRSQIFDLLTEAKFLSDDCMSKRLNGNLYLWR